MKNIKICLLRGVNVSGKNKLKMQELRELLADAGFDAVQTYIQSGNIIFSSGERAVAIEKTIAGLITSEFGYQVPTLVRTRQFFEGIVSGCPYAEDEKAHLHVTILDRSASKKSLTEIDADYSPDSFVAKKDVLYVHCPQGYGRTKLNNQFFEKKLERSATTRNWKTINKLLELSDGT